MTDYKKDIATAKQKAIDILNSRREEMNKASYEILLKAIQETFEFKEGTIQMGEDLINQLKKLTTDVINLINSEIRISGPVSRFVKRTTPTPAFETSKKILIDEIIEKLITNGLNQHFIELLRDLIYQNVTNGLSLADAAEQIEEYIECNETVRRELDQYTEEGELDQFINEMAIQAVSSYSGMMNVKLMQKFNYDALLITGSLIDISSPQCIYAVKVLGGTIKRTDWPKLKEIAEKNGLIDNTTFDNLPFNKLHRGCRHGFSPIMLKKSSL